MVNNHSIVCFSSKTASMPKFIIIYARWLCNCSTWKMFLWIMKRQEVKFSEERMTNFKSIVYSISIWLGIWTWIVFYRICKRSLALWKKKKNRTWNSQSMSMLCLLYVVSLPLFTFRKKIHGFSWSRWVDLNHMKIRF